MKKLFFECEKQSPCVLYDIESNIFEIKGKSFAKYSRHIYQQILEWFNEYIKRPNDDTVFSFRFEFYDSSSAKMILEILKKIDILHNQNKNVEIHWYYPEDDDDIEEAGEIYANLVDAPVKIIPFSIEASEIDS